MAKHWPFSRTRVSKLGNAFSLEEVKDFTKKFKVEVGSDKKDSLASKFMVDGVIRTAEFFGIESINQLISLAKEKSGSLAGIRVYYGLAHESFDEKTGESKISTTPIKEAKDTSLRPRLFLVAVDADGNDIEIDVTGFKDVPDGNGLGNGSPQPPFGNG
jgi:hypothetical protein